MSLFDYESPSEKTIKDVPDGNYLVKIKDMSCDLTGKTPFVEVLFEIKDGSFEGIEVKKRYYFSEKTCQKFLPWQLGIMGIWQEVGKKDNFEQGAQAMIDYFMDNPKYFDQYLFEAELKKEEREFNDKIYKNTNVVLLSKIDNQAKITSPPEPDMNEELPF